MSVKTKTLVRHNRRHSSALIGQITRHKYMSTSGILDILL